MKHAHPAPLAAAVLLLAGCSASQPASTHTSTAAASSSTTSVALPAGPTAVPIGRRGTPRGPKLPTSQTVNGHNASAVAHAYAVVANTSDPRIDKSPNDGARRAAVWLTPDLAAAIRKPLPGDGGSSWAQLVATHGYTTATAIEMTNEEPGSPDRVTRYELVTITTHDRRGKATGQPQRFTLTITLTRQDNRSPWRIANTSTD